MFLSGEGWSVVNVNVVWDYIGCEGSRELRSVKVRLSSKQEKRRRDFGIACACGVCGWSDMYGLWPVLWSSGKNADLSFLAAFFNLYLFLFIYVGLNDDNGIS